MAGWDDVRRIALDLPEAVEDSSGRTTAWRVGGKAFAWERVLRRGERSALGEAALRLSGPSAQSPRGADRDLHCRTDPALPALVAGLRAGR